MTAVQTELAFEPLSDAIGVEVKGLDLSTPLDEATVEALKDVWYDRCLLLFRDQDISNADQERFARYFGELEDVRTGEIARSDMPYTMLITNVRDTGMKTALEDGEMWFHYDQCYYEIPARASALYAMEVPRVGGNTLFANCFLAWETLPEDLRQKLDGLKAHQIYDYHGNPTKRGENIAADAPQYLHPIARTHPETGRKALYVNRLMTDYIEGMSREESDEILEKLFRHSEDPRFIYEHEWRVGDLLLWDNRSSMHARTYFAPDDRRMMRRITVKGEPVI